MAAEALSLGRDDGDAWVVTFALFCKRPPRLRAATTSRLRREHGRRLRPPMPAAEPGCVAPPLLILGHVAASKGDHDRAQPLYAESIEVHREPAITGAWGLCWRRRRAWRSFGKTSIQARAQASEALSLCEELEDPRGIAWSLEVFAGLMAAAGLADGAARLWGAAEGRLANVGGSLNPSIRWVRDRSIERARAVAGETLFDTARTEGQAMSSAQAIAFARQWALLSG